MRYDQADYRDSHPGQLLGLPVGTYDAALGESKDQPAMIISDSGFRPDF